MTQYQEENQFISLLTTETLNSTTSNTMDHQSVILTASIGGALIAIATCINLYYNGKVTGMSGMMYRNIFMDHDSNSWGMMLGLIFVGSLHFFLGTSTSWWTINPAESTTSGLSYYGFIIGGFCVGLGTKLGNGCTSGHGVCGMPRFSKRSWVAVPTFMATAVITANLLAHYGLTNYTPGEIPISLNVRRILNLVLLAVLVLLIATLYAKCQEGEQRNQYLVSLSTGLVFGVGLVVSQMSEREVIRSFLTFDSRWNYALLIVFCGAVGVNLIFFNIILSKDKPLLNSKFEIPTNSTIDWRLLIGSGLFGIGWGICGVCPGPLLVVFPRMIHRPHLHY